MAHTDECSHVYRRSLKAHLLSLQDTFQIPTAHLEKTLMYVIWAVSERQGPDSEGAMGK